MRKRNTWSAAWGTSSPFEDLENVTPAWTISGTPVLLHQVARVTTGPELRRGLAEWNGEGEIVGGIIVMRYARTP